MFRKMRKAADLHDLRAQLLERVLVFDEGALERKNTYLHKFCLS